MRFRSKYCLSDVGMFQLRKEDGERNDRKKHVSSFFAIFKPDKKVVLKLKPKNVFFTVLFYSAPSCLAYPPFYQILSNRKTTLLKL
jgi:hypothetical protein